MGESIQQPAKERLRDRDVVPSKLRQGVVGQRAGLERTNALRVALNVIAYALSH